MPQTLRVRLQPTVRRAEEAAAPRLLQPWPDVVLGATDKGLEQAVPVCPTPSAMFGPRGGALLPDGSLWMADTGHHRLLGWKTRPVADNAAADFVVGQPDFFCEGRNGKSSVTAFSLNVPTGVTACGQGLAVADAWNHRVLLWHETPRRHNQPADVVLGQAAFNDGAGNRGADAPTAETMFWPYGIYWDGARLWVSDTGNRRVLMWEGLPARNGQAADLVLGQMDFTVRDENGGGEPSASSMRWPHSIALWRGRLCVTDAGNNRVMAWRHIPRRDNAPCDFVLGQKDFASVDHNQSGYFPDAACLNMPYGLASVGDWLLAADTASSRLLGWRADDDANGAPARRLAAQNSFQDKGDNRWQTPARDSICWPYGLYAQGDTVLVSDSGNNRALLWRVADEMRLTTGARTALSADEPPGE